MRQINYDSVAEFYDIYALADYDVQFFVSEIRKVKGPVLELMAGTGRMSIPLLEAGAKLTCVDGARGMLDVLARKIAAKGLHAELLCRDVRTLKLPPRFELVVVPFQSFMELVSEADQRAALKAVFRCLASDGRLICTLHNPAVRRAHVDGALRVVGGFPAGDGTLVVSGVEQGGDPLVVRHQFYELFGADGQLAWKRVLRMEFSLIGRDAFEAMAVSEGFRPVDLFGSYERAPFEPMTSPFMIWVLEKRRDARRRPHCEAPEREAGKGSDRPRPRRTVR
ncbi:MAG: class I SAM-dependent methyltransferase [Acidobacteriia bacterium]|nr:class I SAM-dependent methyltransferase [Terriglobia bacterium]